MSDRDIVERLDSVVQRICNIMGRGHSLIEFVKDHPGHDFRYAMDATKIKELGWKPHVTMWIQKKKEMGEDYQSHMK